MRLSRALDDKKLDTRLRDKLVADGKISSTDIEGYLKELPDDAANSIYTNEIDDKKTCLLYTSPSPRDQRGSRMPSSA